MCRDSPAATKEQAMTLQKPRRGRNVKKIVGLVCLGALCVGAAIMGVRVTQVAQQTMVEAATTPTPVPPPAANMLAVTPDPNAPTPEPVLKNGSEGDQVKTLQARLQELGYYSGEIDGQFGNGTREAVYLFQQQNGLSADGVVGSDTRALLYSVEARPMTVTPTPPPETTPANAQPWDVDGMPLLGNKEHPLPEDYACANLVNMTDYCDPDVVKIKANGIEGEQVAVDALMVMLQAAQAEGIDNWQVSAGWRSVGYQQQLLDDKIAEYKAEGFSSANARSAALKTVAEPGTSEHHTGLAFDITVPGVSFKGTEQSDWISEHCWEYGFILRYAEDKEDITGFVAEAWHFRYVGTEHSLIMRDENLCLEEYIEKYGPAAE